MKKFKDFMIASFIFSLVGLGCADEKIISNEHLPSEVREYVQSHFPNDQIVQAVKDREGLKNEYIIILNNGVTLEFKSNKIKEVKSTNKLNDHLIPSSILSYVNEHYPNNNILEWKMSDNKQEALLDNGLELEFDKEGNFIKID